METPTGYPPPPPPSPFASPSGTPYAQSASRDDSGGNTTPPSGPSTPPGGPTGPDGPHQRSPQPEKPRRIWFPVTAAALGAALGASALTAGLTGAFDTDTGTPIAQETQNVAPAHTTAADSVAWQSIASDVRPSVVAITARSQASAGEGSGVIIDDDGHIVTNHHVVADAQELAVTLSDGRILEASVVGSDPTTDLAVLEVSDAPDDLKPASLATDFDAQVGDPVMAVGNPLGLDSTVTTGIISALDRPVTAQSGGGQQPFGNQGNEPVVTNAIQIDAAINPGNSGGPLFNSDGDVIGINSSIAALSQESGNIGLGFAIPVRVVDKVADQLIEDGEAQHAFLGVTMSDGQAEADGVRRTGAKVQEVVDGSPAQEAEIQPGDVIVAFDDKAVASKESLTGFVREFASGDDVKLTIIRDGTTQDVNVTLQSTAPKV